MNSQQVELLLNLAIKCMNSHVCTNNNEGRNATIIKTMDIILALNDYARQLNGEVPLDIVKGILNQNRGEAILLLVGDERLEAKQLLLDCIINPERSQLFYLPHIWDATFIFAGNQTQMIGPFLALISSDIDAYLVRADDQEAHFHGRSEWLRFVSDYPGSDETADTESITFRLTNLLKQLGAYNATLGETLNKIARVFLLETYSNSDGCFEQVSYNKIIGFSKEQPRNHILFHNHLGELDSFNPVYMFDGKNKHIMIDDPCGLVIEHLVSIDKIERLTA